VMRVVLSSNYSMPASDQCQAKRDCSVLATHSSSATAIIQFTLKMCQFDLCREFGMLM